MIQPPILTLTTSKQKIYPLEISKTVNDLSRKMPQWKKTAVEKVYGDKDYSI